MIAVLTFCHAGVLGAMGKKTREIAAHKATLVGRDKDMARAAAGPSDATAPSLFLRLPPVLVMNRDSKRD